MNRFQQLTLAAFTAVMTIACASVPASSSSQEPWFSQAEIDQMLAPVALYPDSVLSHVLIASTYPLEVVQAARWSRENPGLDGEAAVAAVEHSDWDPSVMALVAFPELLKRMDDDIQWTQRLGDAFLVQEADVVASIQHLRDQAYASGHLRSNEHVRVVRETKVIYIEPVRTRTVYVPYYDPRVVYGSWRWSAYPPVYWRHPPRYVSGVSFYWGPAYHIAPSFYFSSFHWSRQRVVVVNHNHYYGGRHFRSGREVANYREARHWRHNPHHRRGVSYHRGVAENRFVERSATTTRAQASAPRAVRQRGQQREWAADQRRSLNLRESSSAQPTQQRSRAATQRQSRSSATARNNAPAERSDSRRAIQSRQNPRTESTQSRGASSTQPALNGRERVQRSQPQLRERLSRQRSPERTQGLEPSSATRSTPTRRGGIEVPGSLSAPREMPRARTPTRSSSAPAPSASRPVMPSRSAPVRPAPTQSAPTRSAPRQAPARSAPAPRSMPSRTSAPPQQRSAPAPRTRSAAPSRSDSRSRVRSRDGGEQRRQQ